MEVAADVDIFATVAKIRALRFTWAHVLRASGVNLDGNHDGVVRVSAVSSYRTLTTVDPWVNLLRGTAACLGAVIGGADTVTIAPFDAAEGLPGDLGRRMARNTQLILADEAGHRPGPRSRGRLLVRRGPHRRARREGLGSVPAHRG